MVFIWVTFCTLTVLFFHELGHVLTARLCGIEVERVSIGVGPELTTVRDKRGTTWRLGLWPIGAYTIYGPAGSRSQKADRERPSRWAVAMIFAAGIISNLLLAVLVLLVAWVCGYPVSVAVALTEPLPGLALLLSGISILMAICNLLPAPPLDGWLLARLALGYECSLTNRENR